MCEGSFASLFLGHRQPSEHGPELAPHSLQVLLPFPTTLIPTQTTQAPSSLPPISTSPTTRTSHTLKDGLVAWYLDRQVSGSTFEPSLVHHKVSCSTTPWPAYGNTEYAANHSHISFASFFVKYIKEEEACTLLTLALTYLGADEGFIARVVLTSCALLVCNSRYSTLIRAHSKVFHHGSCQCSH